MYGPDHFGISVHGRSCGLAEQYPIPTPYYLFTATLGYAKILTSQHHSKMWSGERVLGKGKLLGGFKYICCFPMKGTTGISTAPFSLLLAPNMDTSLYLSWLTL